MKKRRLCGSVPGLGSDYAHDPIIETPDPIEEAIHELQDAVEALEDHDELQDDQIEKLFTGDITFARWHGAKGDGITDDTEAIQAALDAGKTNVFIDPGFYIVTATLHIPAGTRLIGYRAELSFTCGTPDVYASHIMLTNETDGRTGGYAAASTIEIAGLSFSAPGDAYATLILIRHASNVSIHDCVFHALNGWHFIEVNSSRNVRIYNNDFSDYPHNGVWTHVSEMIQLDVAHGADNAPTCEPFDDFPCDNITIENNSFRNAFPTIPATENEQYFPVGVGGHTGVSGSEHRNVTVSSNRFSCLTGAMRFVSLINSRISGNEIHDCAYGIRTNSNEAGYHCTIENNVIDLFRYTKAQLEPAISTGQWQIYRGISVEPYSGSPFKADGLIISGNTIDTHFGYGIAFTATNAVVSGNKVKLHGASDYDVEGMSTSGIYAYCCIRALISSNVAAADSVAYGHGAIRLHNNTERSYVVGNLTAAPGSAQIIPGTNATNTVSTDNVKEVIT